MERLRNDLEQLFSRFETFRDQHQLIRKLDRAILKLSNSSPREVLDTIVDEGRRHTASQHAQIVVVRRNGLFVAASTEARRVNQDLPLDHSLCGTAIRVRENQNCPDVSLLPPGSYFRFHKSTRSELAVLIKSERVSRILGVLNFERSRKEKFDEEAVSFAELLAGQAAIAIEQARIWQSIDMIHSVSTDLLAGEMMPGKAFDQILNTVLESLNFEHGQILRRDSDELVIIASSRKDDLGLRIGPTNSVCGLYLIEEHGRTPLIIGDIGAADEKYGKYYLSLLRGEGEVMMRSELIMPLIREDRLVGALNLESPQPGAFSKIDQTLLSVVAGLIEHALFVTFGRIKPVHRGQIDAANLAMAHLGYVAQRFLHDFGSHIGHVRLNLPLLERSFGNQLSKTAEINEARTLVGDLLGALDKANSELEKFRDDFNPAAPKFQNQKMDLAEVAQSAIARFVSSHPNESIRPIFRNELPSETSRGDKVMGRSLCELSFQVYDVLQNLFNNALDAIHERRRNELDTDYQGRIEVVVDLPDPLYPRLQVIDNGIGIPEANQEEEIFRFGFTTKRRPGGGIGLWFCRYYVHQRGGHIACKSTLGEGTTFEIQFPASFQDA